MAPGGRQGCPQATVRARAPEVLLGAGSHQVFIQKLLAAQRTPITHATQAAPAPQTPWKPHNSCNPVTSIDSRRSLGERGGRPPTFRKNGENATLRALHIAIGAPQDKILAGCDLRQPVILEQDWGGLTHLPGKRIAPLDQPGFGVSPPAAIFA